MESASPSRQHGSVVGRASLRAERRPQQLCEPQPSRGRENAEDQVPARGDQAGCYSGRRTGACPVTGESPVNAVASAPGGTRPRFAPTQQGSFSRRLGARRHGRPPPHGAALLASVRVLIAELPTCGYRCVNAHIRRRAEPRRLHVADDKRLNLVLREQSLPAWRHRAGLNLDVLPRGCDDPIVKSASRIGTDAEALQRPGT
jgi:hypothetical protein